MTRLNKNMTERIKKIPLKRKLRVSILLSIILFFIFTIATVQQLEGLGLLALITAPTLVGLKGFAYQANSYGNWLASETAFLLINIPFYIIALITIFGTKKFSKILLDSSDLLLLSVVVLFLAAVVEVYVTPILF